MTSTPDDLLGLELQGVGDNLNTWGVHLNAVVSLIGQAIAGRTAFALSGPKTLSSTNYVANEARGLILDITGGTGGTLTVPNKSKAWLVRSNATGDVVFTCGGASAVVSPGEMTLVICDGTDCARPTRLRNQAQPTSSGDAATKAYVDATAWTYNAGALPGQTGNAGKVVTTDGAAAAWKQLTPSDVSGLSGLMVALATAL